MSDSADVSAQRGSDGGLAVGSLRRFSLTEGAEGPLMTFCPLGVGLGVAMEFLQWVSVTGWITVTRQFNELPAGMEMLSGPPQVYA